LCVKASTNKNLNRLSHVVSNQRDMVVENLRCF